MGPYYDQYGGRSSSGLSLQVLIGIVIAIVGVISYYSKTSVNPVTGEKQHVSLSPSQEIALGMQSAPEMAREMGGALPLSDPRAAEVQKIGQFVMSHSDADRSPYAQNFSYHLLNDTQTVNAFALPGGQVFITLGLYDKLKTEAELAGVLGHETGHVVERHAAQQMAKSQLGQTLVTATSVGAYDPNHPYQSMGTAAIASFVDKMKQLSFSREDETQADTCGLTYMTEAGFDPRAMLQVMDVLQKITQQTGRQPEMLQTHPFPEHRIETIQSWIKQKFPNGVPSNLTEGGPLH